MRWRWGWDNRGQNPDIDSLAVRPKHVGIIMDGNGRWARRRGLPRIAGHHAGMQAMKETIRACDDLGIEYLTLYAFSTENWKRPQREVEFLMKLPRQFFITEIDELMERNVRIRVIGDTEQLPADTRETVLQSLERTKQNTGMNVNFALNYGGRMDIVFAVRKLAEAVAEGRIAPQDIDESALAAQLSTAHQPDPDFIIRTSGEIRLSNFLVWQSAYAELWFTDVLWPDFNRQHLLRALQEFSGRQRRFGDIGR
ncbi:isoprenyl transferase [Alicyclobacillus tolerans]|uniref:Isoprenyl transferase n=2 Tax=Alicyclobacillus tolerans TaxID=90970 RepID=A0A1M6RLH6_9BACL|nr:MULTISPECIES: isoprenyl transferase [Alicyclobacillus]MDP9728875.1 undecaprenyl diphosphate synthase [Alicyclobacillus tengchongensis]SHK33207.1 undecaprenyl diphosphate synthase [Alicyclobacillus montanus]